MLFSDLFAAHLADPKVSLYILQSLHRDDEQTARKSVGEPRACEQESINRGIASRAERDFGEGGLHYGHRKMVILSRFACCPSR